MWLTRWCVRYVDMYAEELCAALHTLTHEDSAHPVLNAQGKPSFRCCVLQLVSRHSL